MDERQLEISGPVHSEFDPLGKRDNVHHGDGPSALGLQYGS